jgi:hypothetical protein
LDGGSFCNQHHKRRLESILRGVDIRVKDAATGGEDHRTMPVDEFCERSLVVHGNELANQVAVGQIHGRPIVVTSGLSKSVNPSDIPEPVSQSVVHLPNSAKTATQDSITTSLSREVPWRVRYSLVEFPVPENEVM